MMIDERTKIRAILDEVILIMKENETNVEDTKKAIAILAGIIRKLV